MRAARHSARIVVFSVGYFAVAMLVAVIARGTDLDQLRSRSRWSRGAAVIDDLLWAPHNAGLRALPNDWLAHHTWFIPVALVLNCIVWGASAYALWLGWQYLRRRSSRDR